MLSEAEIFYRELVGIFNSGSDKIENKHIILDQLTEKFRTADQETIYALKVLMETQFMRDVKYNYAYILTPTPDKHGCDIRELLFNVAVPTQRQTLLGSIRETAAKQPIPHILTDIDDTLFPNFNGFIETVGSDRSWKPKTPYPGIKLFYKLFYKNIPLNKAKYSTIITGTPLFLKQNRINNDLLNSILGPNFGFMHGFDKKRQVLYALLKGLYERPFYKFAISSQEVANVKFLKYKQYIQVFPEYKILFIGDNGQGDLIAGKLMINHDPTTLVFIHNLMRGNDFIFNSEQEAAEKTGTDGRLYFFKNYLELGYIFSTLGLFTKKDYQGLRLAIAEEIKASIPNGKNLNTMSRTNVKHLYSHYLCPNPAFPEYVCLSSSLITRRNKRNSAKKTRRQV